jgi:hypothetical protein
VSSDDGVDDDDELLDPEEAERRISAFIAEADQLRGRPVDELADAVADVVRRMWHDISAVVADQPHNKILATQLRISQRARHIDATDDEHWRLHAASTLLSALIIPPSG